MDNFDASVKKNAIIATTWEYLLKTGLSDASVGELCKEAKLSQSSLYYWFENKDDIWISAGKYGTAKVVEALLDYTTDHLDNIRYYFDTLLDEVEKHKYELRLAVQITTSPVFGDRMREKALDFNPWYERYGLQLMHNFGCTVEQAQVFIFTIIAIVIDYAIWDEKDKAQMLLENLYERTVKILNSDTK